MALSDLNRIEADFDKERAAAAKKLRALINKRLALLKKVIPGAVYIDAMGTQSVYDKNADPREDALVEATDNIQSRRQPRTEESWGEPLPEYLLKATILTNEYADIINEIFEIGEYLNETVRDNYSL